APVLACHRQGFQLYWRWKSRRRSVGRRPLDLELRMLIRRMARENPTWGRRRIQAELRFLGYEVAELTVAKYMRRPSPRPSSTWRAFLEAHIGEIVAIDFFVVPTLTFQLLFGFLILRHHRRELVHVNATDHPTAAWAAHQLVESFPEETAPKYLLRDRDAIYGSAFVRRVKGLGMSEFLIAPRAPGRIPSLNASSGRFDGNASITSLCSTSGIFDVSCAGTSRTTTPPARISPSATKAPIRGKHSRERPSPSSRFRRSDDFTTATSAP